MIKHFLNINDYSASIIKQIVYSSLRLKKEREKGHGTPLKGKKLAMIFQKPSNRTRISFEVGMVELGGYVLYIDAREIGLGVREPIRDVSQVLSRYVDMVLIRSNDHDQLLQFAQSSSIPIINGLSNKRHPCQALADALTIFERFGEAPVTITYLGDGNNVCSSLIAVANAMGWTINVSSPLKYKPLDDPSSYCYIQDPKEAVKGVDVIYTDAWISMGQEAEAEARRSAFVPYQVTESILKLTHKDAIFMHCMPVNYGEETLESVALGNQSVMLDQAENRLHAQKAILLFLGDLL